MARLPTRLTLVREREGRGGGERRACAGALLSSVYPHAGGPPLHLSSRLMTGTSRGPPVEPCVFRGRRALGLTPLPPTLPPFPTYPNSPLLPRRQVLQAASDPQEALQSFAHATRRACALRKDTLHGWLLLVCA